MRKLASTLVVSLFVMGVMLQPSQIEASQVNRLDTESVITQAKCFAKELSDEELFYRASRSISDTVKTGTDSVIKNLSSAKMVNSSTGEVRQIETVSTIKLLGEVNQNGEDVQIYVSDSYALASYDVIHGSTSWDKTGGVRARTTIYFATAQDYNGVMYIKMLWSVGSWVNYDYPQTSLSNMPHTFSAAGFPLGGGMFFNQRSTSTVYQLSFTRNAPSYWPYINDSGFFVIGDGTDVTITHVSGSSWDFEHRNHLYSLSIF